jgi:hypothetical protein
MTDVPAKKWQFGLAKLFWLQFAFTPLILGGAIGGADLRNRELWLGTILVVVPALYAILLSIVFIPPSGDLPTLLHRRTMWGMVFGALYSVLLMSLFFLVRIWSDYGERRRHFAEDVLFVGMAVGCSSSLVAVLGGIAAGTWTALSSWAMCVFKKR